MLDKKTGRWMCEGTVVDRLHGRSYEVRDSYGTVFRRNRVMLRPIPIPTSSPSNQPKPIVHPTQPWLAPSGILHDRTVASPPNEGVGPRRSGRQRSQPDRWTPGR